MRMQLNVGRLESSRQARGDEPTIGIEFSSCFEADQLRHPSVNAQRHKMNFVHFVLWDILLDACVMHNENLE